MTKFSLFLLALTLAPPVYGQELKLDPIPQGDSLITPVKEGEPAPYAGQLFDDATALRWANWLRQAKLVYRIDMQAEQKKGIIDYVLCEEQLRIRDEQYNRVIAEYSEKLKEVEARSRNPPWYSTVEFGAVLGGAAVLVVGVGSIWAAGQLKE